MHLCCAEIESFLLRHCQSSFGTTQSEEPKEISRTSTCLSFLNYTDLDGIALDISLELSDINTHALFFSIYGFQNTWFYGQQNHNANRGLV